MRLAAELQRRLDHGHDYSALVRLLFAALLDGADETSVSNWLDALEAQRL